MFAFWRRTSWPAVLAIAVLALALAGGVMAVSVEAVGGILRARSTARSDSVVLRPDELQVEGAGPLWGALTVVKAKGRTTAPGGPEPPVVKGPTSGRIVFLMPWKGT